MQKKFKKGDMVSRKERLDLGGYLIRKVTEEEIESFSFFSLNPINNKRKANIYEVESANKIERYEEAELVEYSESTHELAKQLKSLKDKLNKFNV